MRHAWVRFWFTPQPTASLALFRIAFGSVVFFWTVALLPDLNAFFSVRGVEPVQPRALRDGSFGLLGFFNNSAAVTLMFVVLLLAAACLVVGYRTRIASVVVFVGVMSLQYRSPSVFNAGDALIRILAFFLMFAPAGASLSLDRRRVAPGRFWEFPARSVWALRLIQLQICVLYLASVAQKLEGRGWTRGTAVSYALRIADLQRFPVPGSLTRSVLFSTLMTYLTLAVELMIPFLVWNRSARPLVLGLGAGLHLSIDYAIRIGFFTPAILVAYIVFMPPEFATSIVLAVRKRLPLADHGTYRS